MNDKTQRSPIFRALFVPGDFCLVYSAFILLPIFMPNELSGRLMIFCCGAIITGIGWTLKTLGKRAENRMQGS